MTLAQEPFILRLPNEILRQIFSLLSDPFQRYRVCLENGYHGVASILALRSVSRRFRSIVNDLDFWHNDDFMFDELRRLGGSRSHKNGKFLDALLIDQELVSCLGRKAGWKFSRPDEVSAVVERIPSFSSNSCRVELSFYISPKYLDATPAIKMLSSCLRLSTLLLNSVNVDLDIIPKSLPFLQDLSLSSAIPMTEATLEPIANLRKLCLAYTNSHAVKVLSLLVPVNSADSLTTLGLNYSWAAGPSAPPDTFGDSLDPFINLIHLKVKHLSNTLCEFIARAGIKLTSLDILVEGSLVTKMANMISAQSLQMLKVLSLSVHIRNHQMAVDYCPGVVSAVTRYLQYVEELELIIPLDLRSCQYLERMKNLKVLRLTLVLYGTEPLRAAEFEEWDNDPIITLERALDIAFRNFPTKPIVSIRLRHLWKITRYDCPLNRRLVPRS